MVTIRTENDIVLALLDFYKVSLPDADTKPGTVIRDIAIDGPASVGSLLYAELAKVVNLQSLRLVAANDLDRLAQNFGATRKTSVKSSGVALATFSSLPAVVSINKGDILSSSNGSSFAVVNGISVDPAKANSYKSIAIKYQNDLNFLNITDPYAVEITVQATTPGIAGNVSKYTINSTNINGVSNITNVFPFTGGSNQEDDATFRNRVLSIFSGSNIGTALGYKNTALADSSVEDALVIGPGDPLMIRDGTQVIENADGSNTIISEGTGGKVDIIVLGKRESQYTDTFIYKDKSNKNDPTDASNIFVLGQIIADANKTITRKRIDDIKNATLPAQPVDALLSITGSLSGANFLPKSVDDLGRISGNYELIKDTGAYSGSPFGSDKFHWVNNKIAYQEDRVKLKYNGQDNASFTDVIDIPNIQQNISITNENSFISTSDRSIIQLIHTPATNITRVVNVNTGERYTITDQNLDGDTSVNQTGRIQISGNTLPASSDILEVDYTWIVSYDPYSDYDGKILKNNPRPSVDSVDWGMSNVVRNERVLFTKNTSGTFFTGVSKLNVSSIIYANKFSHTDGYVSLSIVPNFSNRNAIALSALSAPIDIIEGIKLKNTENEIYFTSENDGTIINTAIVVGIDIKYNVTIILPTDTPAIIGNDVSVIYNNSDCFNITNSTGSFVANQITIPAVNIDVSLSSINLDITYITSTQNILTAGITNLPISRSGNGFITNSNVGSINTISSNTIKRENQTIQINGSSQHFVDLTLNSVDYSIITSQIEYVIDLATGKEIWNSSFPGTLTTNTDGYYQLIFSGYNSPSTGDNVLVIYFADDLKRVQPFTFDNEIFSRSFETLQYNFTTNNFYVPLQSFTQESSISFSVIDKSTGLSYASAADGYITAISSNSLTATFDSLSINFNSIDDITGKSIVITNAANINNIGTYDIFSSNPNNTVDIGITVSNINSNQVSIIRLNDNKDIWSSTGNIDINSNVLNLPKNTIATAGDKVVVLLFSNKNLHQAPTKFSITTSDQTNNSGIITVSGTTISQVANIVFTAINDGLTQNVIEAIKIFLGVSSNASVPTNLSLIRIVKLDKVETTTNNEILSVISSYDIDNCKINNNLFYMNEMLYNKDLSNIEFTLPSSSNNLNNIPKIGDKLRITFYFATTNDFENVYFTRNGTLYTNKKFALLDKLFVSSGFNTTQSAKFTLSYFTQPATGSRYKTFYDYIAPKQNERIVIQYNYNSLISDITFAVESSRPINADVLIRSNKDLLVNATVNIVVKQNSIDSSDIVLQNVKDRVVSTINSNQLGGELSFSDIITAAQTVDGVERARILVFNKDGAVGQVLTITAQSNQSFVANNVNVNQENL